MNSSAAPFFSHITIIPQKHTNCCAVKHTTPTAHCPLEWYKRWIFASFFWTKKCELFSSFSSQSTLLTFSLFMMPHPPPLLIFSFFPSFIQLLHCFPQFSFSSSLRKPKMEIWVHGFSIFFFFFFTCFLFSHAQMPGNLLILSLDAAFVVVRDGGGGGGGGN